MHLWLVGVVVIGVDLIVCIADSPSRSVPDIHVHTKADRGEAEIEKVGLFLLEITGDFEIHDSPSRISWTWS